MIPLDRLLVETDAPFMYPNTRASKLPQNVKDALTERLVVKLFSVFIYVFFLVIEISFLKFINTLIL